MTDMIVDHCAAHTAITAAVGNAAQHVLNGEHVTQKAVADGTHHLLNAEHVTNAHISDAARDILLDQAIIRQQLAGITDTVHTDGNASRETVRAEGRNVDNKICDLGHHMEAAFRHTDDLVKENKFEFTRQNAELSRYLSDKISALNTDMLKESFATQKEVLAVERRELERKAICCCAKEGGHRL